MLRILAAIGIAMGCLLASAAPSLAQTEEEFVAVLTGDWNVLDDIYAVDGKTCSVALKDTKIEGGYALELQSCGLEMGMLTSWRIADGQLVLVAGETVVALLGGNQRRMSGDSNIGAPIIMDRVGAPSSMDDILKAREKSGCYYLGFTSTCVDDAQLAKPAVPSDGSGASIDVLVNLNARVEARDDAAVIGVVPAGSCVLTQVCATASDGVWCRASFGDAVGWLRKLALRQETWPVVTFVNQCKRQ